MKVPSREFVKGAGMRSFIWCFWSTIPLVSLRKDCVRSPSQRPCGLCVSGFGAAQELVSWAFSRARRAPRTKNWDSIVWLMGCQPSPDFAPRAPEVNYWRDPRSGWRRRCDFLFANSGRPGCSGRPHEIDLWEKTDPLFQVRVEGRKVKPAF